jgi:anti-repressor protein
MNALVTLKDGQAVTTSLAIAEGTGVQHKNVLELIRKNSCELETFGGVAFETRPFETSGGTQYRETGTLNERQATFLLTLMRNSPIVVEFKKRLVKSFYELVQAKPKTELSRIEILQMALESEQQKIQLEHECKMLELQREADSPKVAFHDQVALMPDAISVSQAAKLAGTGQKRLFQLLRQKGWVNRNNEPYQEKIEQGLLEVKLQHWTHPEQGLQACLTTLVTGKGLTKIKSMIEKISKQRIISSL